MEKSSEILTSEPTITILSIHEMQTQEPDQTQEQETKNKCCTISDEVRCMFLCCVKSWSLSLNSCEGLCSCLSNICLCFSTVALDCNKCLEYIDCDGH